MAAVDKPAPRLRWKLGLGIAGVAILAGVVLSFLQAGNRTMHVFAMYPVVSAGVFFTLIWWVFLSGVEWRTRLKGLAVFAAVVGLLLLIFRFDGFEGAMVPMFSSRWLSPVWPAVAYVAGVGVLFLTSLSWRARGLVSGCFLAAFAAGTIAEVGVFGLKPDPVIPGLGDGDQSEESKLAVERFHREAKKYAGRPTSDIHLSRYAPSQLLRLKKSADWQQWQRVDALAVAVGCSPRAVLKAEPSQMPRGNWPEYRGTGRTGIIKNASIRFDWTHKNPPPSLWRKKNQKLDQGIGSARSSFAIVDNRAYTQEQRPDDGHESVVCYDLLTGTPIWKHDDDSHFEDVQGKDGPRGTPTVVGRRIYTVGATGVLNCLDLVENGKQLWERYILEDAGASNLEWGTSCSPLVVGNLVIVTPGGGGNKAVIAYDRFTGKIRWAAGNHTGSYASPILRRIHGVNQVLVLHGEGIAAYDPNTGTALWSRDGFANGPKINAALPIVVDNKVLLSSSYSLGSILLEVNVDAGKWSVKKKWQEKNKFRLKFNDGVYRRVGNEVYVFGLDETILNCIRLSDGKRMWRRRGQQLGPGGSYGYGQMLLVGETLLITSEDGRVSFVTADPERPKYLGGFQGLNRINGRGFCWNQPALVNGKLLLRNERQVACYELSK